MLLQALGFLGQQRQKAVNNLYSTQSSLCEELASGIEGYVDTLKSIIPAASHSRIFNGLGQLQAVSVSILTKLSARTTTYIYPDNTPVKLYIEALADIYWIHVSPMLYYFNVI